MFAFIDESGDPGFKTDEGASSHFVIAMVSFENSDAVRIMAEAIKSHAGSTLHKGEYKFNKCSNQVREDFFRCAVSHPFHIHAMVIDKSKAPHYLARSGKGNFYEHYTKEMIRHYSDILCNARIIIDGSGDRELRQRLRKNLELREGTIRNVRFKDSRSDVLVQLADMCAGALARSYRVDRPDPWRWRHMLEPRICDIWDC